MLIAKVENDVITVADYRDLFPNVSFPSSGPNQEFLQQNSCLPVTVFLPHNRDTQTLQPTDPYILDEVVYTVTVRDLTQEELEEIQKSRRSMIVVSPLQAKAELISRGLYDEVESIVNASDNQIIKLAWNTASEFRRLSPMVVSIAEAMNWDDAYLDDLFDKASKLSF